MLPDKSMLMNVAPPIGMLLLDSSRIECGPVECRGRKSVSVISAGCSDCLLLLCRK